MRNLNLASALSYIPKGLILNLVFMGLAIQVVAQDTYTTDLIIHSQDDVDAFEAANAGKTYTIINGDLILDPNDPLDPIVDLTALNAIQTVNGSLKIINFTTLDNGQPLEDLTSITTVDSLIIGEPGNPNTFSTFADLPYSFYSPGITTINGALLVENNTNLVDLNFELLNSIGADARVENNPDFIGFYSNIATGSLFIGGSLQIIQNGMTDLATFFTAITLSDSLVVRDNPSLETFTNFFAIPDTINGAFIIENNPLLTTTDLGGVLTYVKGEIRIENNASLLDLGGFEALDSAAALIINNNDALLNLDTLNNLTVLFNSLEITGNDQLADCSQLPCQVTVGGTVFNTVNNDNVTVSGNSGNCADKTAIQNDPAVNGQECVQLALPVELMSFSGALQGAEVGLTWFTATETDNSHFFVERSEDGFTYIAIGRVEGAGTVGYVNDYEYTDQDFVAGVNYYRLRQVDFDGAESLSHVIAIDAGTVATQLGIFPNPVSAGQLLTIEMGAASDRQSTTADVFSASGRLVSQQKWSAGDKLQLPTAGLKPGLYLIRLSSGGRTATERVVIR